MKTVEMVAEDATRKNVENVSEEAAAILRTMLLVGRNYGVDYLVRLVRGYSRTEWKDPSHPQLETFGVLAGSTTHRLKNLVHSMFDFGYVDVTSPAAMTIKITPKGEEFLANVGRMQVPYQKLRLNKYGYLLEQALVRLCQTVAGQKGFEPYKVLSDFAIGRIVRKRPDTLQELKQLPGITLYKAETYGEMILEEVRKIKALQREDYLKWLRNRVKGQTFQETKTLFLNGRTVAQIAQVRGLRETTIVDYLVQLHVAGEIDLRPWIEKYLDAKVLYKGSEYFRSVTSGRFREAYETLGLDYDTLRLCKLYVSDVQTSTHEMEV